MTKEQIASVIETSPVRLTADETRAILRCYQTAKPIQKTYGGYFSSLMELGLVEEVPMETEAARSKRLSSAWAKVRLGFAGKDSEIVSSGLKEICNIQKHDEPEKGCILTELGKQVARGITVRITKR